MLPPGYYTKQVLEEAGYIGGSASTMTMASSSEEKSDDEAPTTANCKNEFSKRSLKTAGDIEAQNNINDELMMIRADATFSTEDESHCHPDDSHDHHHPDHFAIISSSTASNNAIASEKKKKNCSSCNFVNNQRMKTRLLQELVLLKKSWKIILFAAVFQYIHSIATNLVYYLHVPAEEPLRDLGFELLTPPLAPKDQYISEVIFLVLVIIIVGYMAIQPFLSAAPGEERFVINMATRYARVLVLAQTLRIISFLGTILPSPNYHCLDHADANYNPPQSIGEIFLRIDGFTGCGDLIFSSHTIFVTLGGLLINHYSSSRVLKSVVWMLVVVLGFLVVAARKHYTVDVVVAWYTCPLLWFYVAKTWPDDVPPPSTTTIKQRNEEEHYDDDQNTLQEFREESV